MSDNHQIEKIVIPNILLETQGLRMASVDVTDDDIQKAHRLIRLSKNYKFAQSNGVMNWLRNLVKNKRLTPEEIETMLTKVKGLQNPSGSVHPDLQNYTDEMVEFLQNINTGTGKRSFYGPYNRNMAPQWKQIQELVERVENGDANAFTSLQQALGHAGIDAESSLGKYWMDKAFKFLAKDEKWLSKPMPGAYRVGDHGTQNPISIKDFFQSSGQLLHGGAASGSVSVGHVIITDPSAVKNTLQQMSQNISLSAKVRGMTQSILTSGIVAAKGVPTAVGIGATAWGLKQGLENSPKPQDIGDTSNITAPDGELYVNPSLEQSNGLGGTTNGNNIGNLGGQFNPQPTNNTWTPVKPNLPNNPNDWLPTNTTDYYDLVKKSSIDNNSFRVANEQVTMEVPDLESVMQNFFTIVEQGQPGQETLNQALAYLSQEDKKAQMYLTQYQQQNTQHSQAQTHPNTKENQ